MARRAPTFLLFLLLLCQVLPLQGGSVYGTARAVAGLCLDGSTPQDFHAPTGLAEVVVCPAVVETGHALHFAVHARPLTPIDLNVAYPGDGVATAHGMTDQNGLADLSLLVRYNPLNRYVEVQFRVTVGKPYTAGAAVVAGTFTVAQAPPLTNTRLRVHALGAQGWCPANLAACTVRNGATIVIRVDTEAGAQVGVTLYYPDGQSTPCSGNELTGTSLTTSVGVYRCQLPVFFQVKGSQKQPTMLLIAQISADGASVAIERKLWLLPH